LTKTEDDRFVVEASEGPIEARDVVLATGAYQRAYRPSGADALPADLPAIDVTAYANEAALAPGKVLVVGSGQTGCQIAEELHDAGREVFLSCGRAPWAPRKIGDHDLVWWAVETGFLEQSADTLPDPRARLDANIQASGHGGGHDLHFRTLRAQGVTLLGHFLGADGRRARFAPDLADSVAWGDVAHGRFMQLVDDTAKRLGLEAPPIEPPDPFTDVGLEELDLTGFGAAVFTGGFRPDYRSWLPWPDAFDDMGFPLHHDGSSTVVPGLHFVGVHFLRKRKSSLLFGVGEDAAIVADTIAAAG
jgi:putative flavoprotein involved in K+ transport